MNSKSRLTLAMLTAIGVILSATGGRSLATEFDDESAWLPEVEELFVADTYSTPESAARAMAHRLTREIRTQARPCAVIVRVAPGHSTVSSKSIRRAFIESLRTDELVEVLDAHSDVEAVVADLKIDMDPSDGDYTDGALQLSCKLPSEQFFASARFVSKPWVELVHAAEHRESDQHRICVRGLTEQPGIDASRDVIHKAVEEELLQRVLDRTHKRFPSQPGWVKKFVRDRLVRDIVDNSIVADRFQQTFHKTIDGEDHVVMVREAILLDVSDDKIEQLANPMLRQLKRVRERRMGALALCGGGILVSLVVGLIGYIVLNMITRGYYVWKLRAATATFWLVSMTLAARIASAILSAG